MANVVKEFNIGNTKIRFCDDYCRNKTKGDVDEILSKISQIAMREYKNNPISRQRACGN